MRARTLLACGALLAGAGLAPVASAAPLPELAGTTVITGDHTATMHVVVPHAALISYDVKKSVDVEGAGRLVGVRLVERHSEPDVLSVLRLPKQVGSQVLLDVPPASVTGGCTENTLPTGQPVPTGSTCDYHTSGQGRLHRGVYDLYLITDGSPVTVTLHIDNLPGSVTLTPSTSFAAPITPMTMTVNGQAGAPSVSGGGTTVAKVPSTVVGVVWWDQDDSPYGQEGGCFYDSPPSAGGQDLWLPGCPGGSFAAMDEVAGPAPVFGPAVGPAKGGHHGGMEWTGPVTGTASVGMWSTALGARNAAGFVLALPGPMTTY